MSHRNNNNYYNNDETFDDLNDAEIDNLLAEPEGEQTYEDELEEVKRRIQQLDEENQALENDIEAANADDTSADPRSIWIGNVDYGSTAHELQTHFEGCGAIARISIMVNKFTGHPKGFAYVEFEDESSVEPAVALNESLFRGRALQVMPKRTNIPGISTTNRPPFRPRPYRGSRGRYVPRGFAPRGFKASRPRRTFGYAPY